MKDNNLYPAHVTINCEPVWGYISCVRSFVTHFFSLGLQNTVEADKISLAVSELLENAIKYSSGPHIAVDLTIVSGTGQGKEVIVLVKNDADVRHVDTLKTEISRVNGGDDPEKIYLDKMREAVEKPMSSAGLGLIRVRLVSRTKLECLINKETEVTVKVLFTSKYEGR